MADETLASQELPDAKLSKEVESNGVPVKITEENTVSKSEEVKKEEETALEGEFVKVEKESEEKPFALQQIGSDPAATRELLDAQEKVKEHENELKRISGLLEEAESENMHLKDERLQMKEKLEEGTKKHEELELNNKKLLEENSEAEGRYKEHLKALQEALQAQEEKHKVFCNSSSGEARKYEELHRESGLHAESEMKSALELEELLEVAKTSVRETEDQMTLLKGELKSLYEKIAENQKVEEALTSNTAELATIRGELELSKSQVQDIEQMLASKEALIGKLTQELELAKGAESKSKEDIASLENSLAETKEILQVNASQLEDLKLKMKEEADAKEGVQELLKSQETKSKIIEEDLEKATKEKEALEDAVYDLTNNTIQIKGLCNDLEAKLQTSDENFIKADSLLSEAVANSKELELKLKTLEDLHNKSGNAVIIANQKNLELDGILQALNVEAEKAKSELRECETRCIAAEHRTIELEQQLNLEELKTNDYQRELIELSEKLSEVSAELKKELEEKQHLDLQLQEFQAKVAQVESELSKPTARNSELEIELKNVTEKCAEHGERANIIRQLRVELEGFMQTSDSKVANSKKRVSELELLLETEKYRIKELEEQISLLEKKCEDVETKSSKNSQKVSELEAELEAVQLKKSSLEVALQELSEKEKELSESLKLTTEENSSLKDSSSTSNENLSEAENLLSVLQNELSMSKQRLESIENDLKATVLRESEVMEKLKLAEEQLEQQSHVLEKVTARSAELESSHEILTRDADLKLPEAIANSSNRDSEAKIMHEKVQYLENQVKTYQAQLTKATERYESASTELGQILVNLASSEDINEELRRKILEAEGKSESYLSENSVLSENNAQLSDEVKDLEEKLIAMASEREFSDKQLASHMSTIAELTERHSNVSELHLAAEGRIKQAEAQFEEAIWNSSLREAKIEELYEKLKAFEAQVKAYEEQAQEASTLMRSRELELESILSRSKDLESELDGKSRSKDLESELDGKSCHFEKETEVLVDANSKLSQDLAAYKSELRELLTKLSIVSSDKDDPVKELDSARKEIKELTQLFASDGEKLQRQISSIMEENNLLNETFQSSKKDLEAIIVKLEEQLKEHKSTEDFLKAKLEILNSEVGEKAELHSDLKEIEEQLATAEARFNEEKELNSLKDLERRAALKHSFEEIEAKKKEVLLLEDQVKDIQQRLQTPDSKSKEKDIGGATSEQKDVTIKLREIESFAATPSKRKSKKKSEATSGQALPSETEIHTAEASPALNFKFILGVALVSVIIGIILGKRC